MTAVLGNMTPDPSNAEGVAAVNALAASMKGLSASLELLGKGVKGTGAGVDKNSDEAKVNRAVGATNKLQTRIEKLYAVYGTTGKANTTALATLAVDLRKTQAIFKDIGLKFSLGGDASKMLREMRKVAGAQSMGPKRSASPLDNLENKLIDKFSNNPTLRSWRQRNKLAASADTDTKDHFIEQEARQRLATHRQAQTESLQKLEAKWLRREKTDRDTYHKKIATNSWEQDVSDARWQKQQKAIKDKNRKPIEYVRDNATFNFQNGIKNSNTLIRKAEQLVNSFKIPKYVLDGMLLHNKALNDQAKLDKKAKSDASSAKSLQEQRQEFFRRVNYRDQKGLPLTEAMASQANKLGMSKLEAQINDRLQKQSQAKAAEENKKTTAAELQDKITAARKLLAFNRSMALKERLGMGVTLGDLSKAEKLGSPLAAAIEGKLEKQSKERGGEGAGGFFGGVGRNLIIGQFYKVMHEGLKPFFSSVAGFVSPVGMAWSSFSDAAYGASKSLSYITGLAESASKFQYEMESYSARFKRSNALAEMGTNPTGKAASGILGTGASVVSGMSGALGNLLVNPIQGVLDIVGKIGGAVALFDPSTMTRFGLVMREVTATIGMGLTPVMQQITVLVKEFGDYLKPVVQDLGGEFASAIKQLGRELKPLVKLLVLELKQALLDFTSKLRDLNKSGNLNVAAVANELGMGPRQQNIKRLGMLGVGAGAGGLAGAPFGPPGMLIGAGIGALGAAVAADQMAPQWQGKRAAGQELVLAAAGLQRGNVMGTAVASNAQIGSGVDLARRAAQDAFIASSNNGKIGGENVFELAAKKAIAFFIKQDEANKAVDGNAQPGMANGRADNPFGAAPAGKNNPNPFGGGGFKPK